MLAQKRIKGTALEHLMDVPSQFVQQGVHKFVHAFGTSLARLKSEKKFEIHQKNGNVSCLQFLKGKWDKGVIEKEYFKDPFYFRDRPTPSVCSIH
jgi:hypothetical protein